MSQVQEALEAWRAAERRLDAAADPELISKLEDDVAARRQAYMEALELASDDDEDQSTGQALSADLSASP